MKLAAVLLVCWILVVCGGNAQEASSTGSASDEVDPSSTPITTGKDRPSKSHNHHFWYASTQCTIRGTVGKWS